MGQLVLERRLGQKVEIEVAGCGVCTITVLRNNRKALLLGFEAPSGFVIGRLDNEGHRRVRKADQRASLVAEKISQLAAS